jgi:hypothetical protein
MRVLSALKPYSSEKVKFLLEADAQVLDGTLKFEYQLVDSAKLFQMPQSTQKWEAYQVRREDNLWNHTCFEAFLNPMGFEQYYEFNFSLKPAWNLYQFDRYREPQPPKHSTDFELNSIIWNQAEGRLLVEIKNNTEFKKFKIGLTAVLEETGKTNLKHYCALTHVGAKPDFHLTQSFTLIRGS